MPHEGNSVGDEVERGYKVGEGGEEGGLDGERRIRVNRAEEHRRCVAKEEHFAEEAGEYADLAPKLALDRRLVLRVGADEGPLVAGHVSSRRGDSGFSEFASWFFDSASRFDGTMEVSVVARGASRRGDSGFVDLDLRFFDSALGFDGMMEVAVVAARGAAEKTFERDEEEGQ